MRKVKGMGRQTSRALNARQMFQVCDWLQKNVANIQAVRRDVIAEMCTASVGFDVSPSSVTTCIEATGITVKSAKGQYTKSETGLTRQGLHARRMKVLLTFLKELATIYEVEFPVGLDKWLEGL